MIGILRDRHSETGTSRELRDGRHPGWCRLAGVQRVIAPIGAGRFLGLAADVFLCVATIRSLVQNANDPHLPLAIV